MTSITPSFSACPLLSYPICYFLLLSSPRLSTLLSTSIAPPFHPPTPISACVASFYRTACCRCGNKSCLWSKLHGGVRAASSDCATDCRLWPATLRSWGWSTVTFMWWRWQTDILSLSRGVGGDGDDGCLPNGPFVLLLINSIRRHCWCYWFNNILSGSWRAKKRTPWLKFKQLCMTCEHSFMKYCDKFKPRAEGGIFFLHAEKELPWLQTYRPWMVDSFSPARGHANPRWHFSSGRGHCSHGREHTWLNHWGHCGHLSGSLGRGWAGGWSGMRWDGWGGVSRG